MNYLKQQNKLNQSALKSMLCMKLIGCMIKKKYCIPFFKQYFLNLKLKLINCNIFFHSMKLKNY